MEKGGAAGEVTEAGRVLAQLDDWRAITFILVLVIVVLLVERYFTQRDMRLERKAMAEVTNKLAQSTGQVASALTGLQQTLIGLRMTAARVESTAAAIVETTYEEPRRP